MSHPSTMTGTSVDNPTMRVLMVGKSNKLMARMAAKMTPLGMVVQSTQDLHSACRDLDGRDVDVVVVGRALTDEQRREVSGTLHVRNPDLPIVKSMGPYGELVGPQVEAALRRPGTHPAVESATRTGGVLTLRMRRPAEVTVRLLRHDLIWRLHDTVLFTGAVPAGPSDVRIGRRRLGIGGESFALIGVDGHTETVLTL
jgi:hypothetical protein